MVCHKPQFFLTLPFEDCPFCDDYRPAYAVPRILAKTGLTLADIDVIELHEAFAVSCISMIVT